MFKQFKRIVLGACLPIGLTGVAWAAIVVFTGAVTNLNFGGGGGDLIDTPFTITGVPTTSAGLDVVGEVCVIGDFDQVGENPDILGEDGLTVIGTIVPNGAFCVENCAPINISAANYTPWGADGTLTFTLGANIQVDNTACANTVQGEVSVETAGAGTQAIPTLSTWALLLLSSILLLVGVRNKNRMNVR